MDSTPSTLLSESLAAFSKATHKAFATVDAEARATVAEAVSETREARRKRDEAGYERDEAIKARHACQLEMHALKEESDKCKAALAQAEMTIAHRDEIILQLRRERAQWKDQSRNWQEHFLRVEQERCKLSSRIDELTTERLLKFDSQMPLSTITPRPKYSDILDATLSSSTTRRASTSLNRPLTHKSALPSSPEPISPSIYKNGRVTQKITPGLRSPSPSVPISHTTTTTDITMTRQKSTGHNRKAPPHLTVSPAREQRQRVSHPDPRSAPSQIVIRRVQAVVEVPVKQEDADEDSFNPGEHSASDSASDRASRSGSASVNRTHMTTPSRSRSHVKARTSNVVESDEDDDSCLEDGIEEVVDIRSHPNRSYRKHSHNEDREEEDDELRMGAEDNHKELYGTEPVTISSIYPQHRSNNAGKSVGPPSKKRKLVTKASGGPKTRR